MKVLSYIRASRILFLVVKTRWSNKKNYNTSNPYCFAFIIKDQILYQKIYYLIRSLPLSLPHLRRCRRSLLLLRRSLLLLSLLLLFLSRLRLRELLRRLCLFSLSRSKERRERERARGIKTAGRRRRKSLQEEGHNIYT